MNARVDLPPAREVCPIATRRLIGDGALLVDVRELSDMAPLSFNVPGVPRAWAGRRWISQGLALP